MQNKILAYSGATESWLINSSSPSTTFTTSHLHSSNPNEFKPNACPSKASLAHCQVAMNTSQLTHLVPAMVSLPAYKPSGLQLAIAPMSWLHSKQTPSATMGALAQVSRSLVCINKYRVPNLQLSLTAALTFGSKPTKTRLIVPCVAWLCRLYQNRSQVREFHADCSMGISCR